MTGEERTEVAVVTTTKTTEEVSKKPSLFGFEKKTVTLPVNCSTVKRIDTAMDVAVIFVIFVCRLLAPVVGAVIVIVAGFAGWYHEVDSMIATPMIIVGLIILMVGMDIFPYKFVCIKDEPEDKNEP